MPKVNDFINNQHVFLQQTPLQIAGAGGVLPGGGGRRIIPKDWAGDAVADDQTPLVTSVNYNNGALLSDDRLYITVLSHPGNRAASADTWVYFDIEEQCNPYGASCGGVRLRSTAGGGGGGAGRRAYYLPYHRNKITRITLGPQADYFFTDNLSGCAIFIDESTPGAPVVCHANAVNISNDVDPTKPRDFMRSMHHHLRLRRDKTLEKTGYWAVGNDAGYNAMVARKRSWNLSHGWRDIDAQASGFVGAFVVGFRDAGNDTWSFYYQSLAMVKYNRPVFSPSRYTQGAEVYRMVVSHSAQIV